MAGLIQFITCTLLFSTLLAAPARKDTGDNLSRDKRSYRQDYDLDVQVSTNVVNMHRGKSVTIRCRAKGGSHVNSLPHVSFYRQLGDSTHLRMSSGDPGVEIQPSVPSEQDIDQFFGYNVDEDIVRSVKVLTLSPDSWETLVKGENLFYCKVSTSRGQAKYSYFIIKKTENRRRRPHFRRWTIPARG